MKASHGSEFGVRISLFPILHRKGKWLFLMSFFLLFLLVPGSYGQAGPLSFQPVSLERTLISKRFQDLTISGPVPEGAQIILKIFSPTKTFNLNKSGKGLGFIWLPISHASVKNLPGMYALLSSGKISGLLPPEQLKTKGLSPDYQEIYDRAEFHFKEPPQESEAAPLKKEYIAGLIKIMEQGGLYRVGEGAVQISGNQFTARIKQPADAPLGEYGVLCYAVRGGQAELVAQEKFGVKQIGLAEWLTHQAGSNAVLYGILAALIAVAVGILVGMVFKRGGGH